MSLETLFEQELWDSSAPKPGDHIRVVRHGIYSHHGIYISDSEVIHFAGTDSDSIFDWSKCEIQKTDIEHFLRGGILEKKQYHEDDLPYVYPAEDTIQYARFRLGDRGYHLAFNNCEHFANVCSLGMFRSPQVDRVLSGKMPLQEDYPIDENDFSGFLDSAEISLSNVDEMENMIMLVSNLDPEYKNKPFFEPINNLISRADSSGDDLTQFEEELKAYLRNTKSKLKKKAKRIILKIKP